MDVEIENLEVGKSFCIEEVHFTGGLRGLPVEHGWALVPIPSEQELGTVVRGGGAVHCGWAIERIAIGARAFVPLAEVIDSR